jgi:hypothetical protein
MPSASPKARPNSRTKAGSPKSKSPSAPKGGKGAARRVVDGEVLAATTAKTKAKTKRAARKADTKSKPAAKSKAAGGSKTGAAKAARKSKAKAPAKKRAKRVALTAATADAMDLYQRAVQSPETDAAFLARVFKQLRGRQARHMREDFCGTGYLMAAWLKRHRDNTTEGFDIDPDPVAWGLANNFEDLEDAAERAAIHLKDVREPSHRQPDVRTAPNFSWMIFTERSVMLDYFRSAYQDLVEDGLFILDIYGGPEAFEEMEEVRKVEGGFTYVWDQKSYEPASGAYHCRIHFRFKDGTELRNVFDYKWRLWTLPEVVDILREAGFSQVDTWWEGTDEDGVSGNGVFKRSAKGENCPAWVTYIVAQR